jgi:hypothetical protein
MESESASQQREAEDCQHTAWEANRQGVPQECSDCGHRFTVQEKLEKMFPIEDDDHGAFADANEAAASQAAPAPSGGRAPYAVAYYFTVKVGDAEVTKVREIAIPGDATVTCEGNTLVITHEGVADTFRIGRVRPLEA